MKMKIIHKEGMIGRPIGQDKIGRPTDRDEVGRPTVDREMIGHPTGTGEIGLTIDQGEIGPPIEEGEIGRPIDKGAGRPLVREIIEDHRPIGIDHIMRILEGHGPHRGDNMTREMIEIDHPIDVIGRPPIEVRHPPDEIEILLGQLSKKVHKFK